MSKKPWVKKSTSDGGKKNELHVHSSMNSPKWEIKIWGEDNSIVRHYHDLSADPKKNRAVVTLSFDSDTSKYLTDDLNEVTYRVVNPNPSSWAEWKKMRNEALTNFIIESSSDSLKEVKSLGDLKCTLQKQGDKEVNILIEKSDGTGSKVIESNNLEIEAKFYHKEVIEENEFVPIASKPKTAWWKTTTGKITILGVAGAILLLIIIFHKKIWGWIKPEKKKPSETIIL